MDRIAEIVGTCRPVVGELLRIAEPAEHPFGVADPAALRVEVSAGASGHLIVLHETGGPSRIDIVLGADSRFEFTELFLGPAVAEVALRQDCRSRCRMTTVQLCGSQASYGLELEGREAENEFGGVFLVGSSEQGVLRLQTSHRVSDCRSDTSVRGIAGGTGVGEFSGMVYVAKDAQRTDARQQSRNLLLDAKARIKAQPQLEIYADDVRCSHGATVGQLDAEAVYYMRQRGLSESQARRMQLEGFVGDIVGRIGIEPLFDAVMARVAARMEKM